MQPRWQRRVERIPRTSSQHKPSGNGSVPEKTRLAIWPVAKSEYLGQIDANAAWPSLLKSAKLSALLAAK
jgi:hypothetical protein